MSDYLFKLAAYAVSDINLELLSIIPHLFSPLFILCLFCFPILPIFTTMSPPSFFYPSFLHLFLLYGFPSSSLFSNHVSYILPVHGFPSFPTPILNAILSSLLSLVHLTYSICFLIFHPSILPPRLFHVLFCYPASIFHSVVMWLVHQIKMPRRKVRNSRSVGPWIGKTLDFLLHPSTMLAN